MTEKGREIIARVYRYDPLVDTAPRYETYEVPWREKITVLELLRYIFENYEPISFRYECRMMQCGLCAVQIDGDPRLACATVIEKPSEITIEPLKGFPVIKDLVVDRSETEKRILGLKPYLQRTKPPTQEPEIIKSDLQPYFESVLLCRECYVCHDACPVTDVAWEKFCGPTLMIKYMAPRVYDPRDDGDRVKQAVSEGLWYCTDCGACKELCWRHVDVPVLAYKRIRERAIEKGERGLVPPKIRDFLENIYKYGNPWGEPRENRGAWTEGTEVRHYKPGLEFLYYVGCVGSYDTRANKMAKALGEIMLKSGISFGVLGSDEDCDGNEVNMLGEKGLFQFLAEKNIQKFKKLSVKKIITLSPHAYNAIKNEYPAYSGNFEVMHYTQLLRETIKSGKLNVSKGLKTRVTYHDPCFLGRYNKEYDAPRDILKSISGIELLEMKRSKENSFCCGGGAGQFYTSLLDSAENSLCRIRCREAYETGAEILAVACPVCLTMFDDAVKMEGLEDKLTVKDISEILKEATEL